MLPLTREQVRNVDRLAIEELGIPGVVLMENAGRNAVALIEQYTQQQGRTPESAHIYCGGGNNGGDGYVIARHLHNHGTHVTLFAHKPINQLTGDAKINADICQKMNLPILPTPPGVVASAVHATTQTPNLIIDALLGTGFHGELRDDILHVIRHINAQRDQPDPPTVVAIDIPSGLDCDTGKPPTSQQGELRHAVIADLTITFVAPKLGFSQPAAWPYVGKVEVAEIGAPPQCVRQARLQ